MNKLQAQEAAQRLRLHRLRLLNLSAENALRRGRKLTSREKIENLEQGLGLEPGYFARMRNVDDDN